MHESGVFDVQSHTRSHAKVFCDAAVTGFVSPAFANEPYLDRPLAPPNGSIRFVEPDALGTPLYLRRSRMSDARRFLPDEGTAERCRQHVARNGGAHFFDRPGWRAELERLAAGNGRFETDDEREAAILDEINEGRALLNDAARDDERPPHRAAVGRRRRGHPPRASGHRRTSRRSPNGRSGAAAFAQATIATG